LFSCNFSWILILASGNSHAIPNRNIVAFSSISFVSCISILFPKTSGFCKNTHTYVIDTDQRPDSNQRPLLKSVSTGVIISNNSPFLWPIYWLGLLHTSVMSLNVDLRKWETAIDLRIGCRFKTLKKGHRSEVQNICDVEFGHGFGGWTSIWVLHNVQSNLL
jgi:hypothetical protein